MILSAILISTAIAYLPVWRGEFLGDEYLLILNNPQVRHPERMRNFFREQFWPGKPKDIYYRPLVMISYALNWKLGKADPLGYHLFNLALHLASVLLFYLLFRKWFPDQALLAAALFALHPVLTEAVSKISGRTDLLAGFFILLSWLLWSAAEGKPGAGRIVIYITIALSSLLAMFSKEIGLLLPFLFLAGDWRKSPDKRDLLRNLRRSLWGYLLVVLSAVIYFWLRSRALAGIGLEVSDPFLAGFPAWQKPLLVSRILLEYLRLQFFPILLGPDYFYTHKFGPGIYPLGPCILAALFWSAALLLLIWNLFRRKALALPAILWLTALLPVAHIVPIPPALAERFLYLPSVFYALAFSLFLCHPAKPYPRTIRILTGILIAGFFFLTFFNSRSYQTRQLYYRSSIKKVPEEKVFHNLLGLDDLEHKFYRRAEKQLLWALALDPNYPETLVNLGIVKYKLGDRKSEEELYQRAIQASPDYAAAHYNLGVALLSRGQMEPAQAELEKASRLDPLNPAAFYWLARIALLRNEINNAKALLDSGIKIADWYLPALKLRIRMALEEKDFEKARELIQKAEKFAPNDPELNRFRAGLSR